MTIGSLSDPVGWEIFSTHSNYPFREPKGTALELANSEPSMRTRGFQTEKKYKTNLPLVTCSEPRLHTFCSSRGIGGILYIPCNFQISLAGGKSTRRWGFQLGPGPLADGPEIIIAFSSIQSYRPSVASSR